MKTGIYWQDPEYAVGRGHNDPSCVLYLPLHRLDGASFMSKDAYGHLCTVTGALWTPQGRSFDGSDDLIDCGNPVALGETTFEWWMKTPHDWTAYKGIFDLSSGTFYTGLHMMPNTGKFYLRLNSSNRREFYNAPADLSGWHYYVLYIAGSGINDIDNSTLEIDGAALTPGSTVKTNAPLAWDKFILGMSDYGFLECTIDEVRIYNRGLTPLEIQHHYLAAKWRYR